MLKPKYIENILSITKEKRGENPHSDDEND